MKQLIFPLILLLFSGHAYADAQMTFTATAVEDAINTLVDDSNRQNTADEYQKQMDQTTGQISVIGMYKVCAAAGFDINDNNGYNLCRNFIRAIADKMLGGLTDVNEQNCVHQMNGVWALNTDDGLFHCMGKDGHELVYNASCVAGAAGECVQQFSSLSTQGPIGREFIAAYADAKKLNLTCAAGYDTRRTLTSPLGQDYIKCSAGGKAYEFEFDSLNKDPGDTSVHSENSALCAFFGGKMVSASEKLWDFCDIARDICTGPLSALASRIGHSTMYQGYCRLSNQVKGISTVELHKIDGVDNYIFYKSGAQMRADIAIVQLTEYLRTLFPNESYIACDPNPKTTTNDGFGADIDYILTCTVGHQSVDFVFDDLSESSTERANAGMDAMQCIINGGTFKGESCRGPTQTECTNLDAALRARGSAAGAYWDNDVRACILGNAMKSYKTDVAVGYVVGAVVIIGGTVASVLSGGAVAPVVVAGIETLTTDLAINWIIDANHQRLSQAAANRYGNFMTDATQCTTEQCALDVLKKHFATLSGVMGDLNTDDQAVVDETMDRLIGLIQTEFVACGTDDAGQTIYAFPADCAMQSSKLHAIDYIDKISEPVLIIGSIVYNPGYVTKRFTQVKNISKTARALGVSSQDAKQLMKSGSNGNLKAIGKFDESFITTVKTDDFIANLEKEGYHIEYTGNNILGKKSYTIYADAGKDTDIERIQMKFLESASDTDRDARLASVGFQYKPTNDPWYTTYEEITLEYLSKDPDIAQARNNWNQMSEWDRYQVLDQTNRKIRRLIAEDPDPISYERVSGGAAAAYRPGSGALEKGVPIDYDTYFINTKTKEDFDDVIGHLIHENYHYSQHIGKTNISQDLLDYNDAHYTNAGSAVLGEYHMQPLERGVKYLGLNVSDALANSALLERLDEMREMGTNLQKMDDVKLRQLGENMVSFIDTKTYDNYQTFRSNVEEIRGDATIPTSVLDYIKSFDNRSFWDRARNLSRKK